MPRQKKQHLKRRPDGRYACRYKTQWFYGDTEDEALALREEYKKAEKEGSPLRSNVSVAEYATAWLPIARPSVTGSTYHGLAVHLEHLTKRIGDVPVADVRPIQIKEVYSSEYLGLSQSYITSAKQIFVALFDSAVENGICKVNPARSKDAQPHKGETGGHRSITDQERLWINSYCKDHRAYPVVMTMLYAGLRPQEAKALVVDRDVDFDQETITVRETAHTDEENGQKYVFTGKGKTDRANRSIPLLPQLKTALEGRTGLLITSAHGEPVSKTTWRVAWRSYVASMETAINGVDRRWYGRTREHKAILAAGGELPPWIPFTVTPYDLRHSFATMLRDMHPPIEMHTVIKWMGHADATMVLRIYDSVTDSRDRQEAERAKKAFRSQNGSQKQNSQP